MNARSGLEACLRVAGQYCVSAAYIVAAAFIAEPAWAQRNAPDLEPVEMGIMRGDYGNVHGVVALRNGKRIADWYFSGADVRRPIHELGIVHFASSTLHDVRSVTKSIVALLFGLAQDEGYFANLDEPILNYFPEYADLRTPERMRIRLRDLLSLKSGLEWNETETSYTLRDPRTGEITPNPANSEIAMDLAADRYRYILSRPIAAVAGERFAYSGGDVALLAEIIARATHRPIDHYARERLFAPLGIRHFEWLRDHNGIPIAASGLRLRPRDMARIGQLVAADGLWRGRQLVSKDWITAMTTPRALINGDANCGVQYGYLWWMVNICTDGAVWPLIFANGNGGQKIWIDRRAGIVVAITAGFYDNPGQDRTDDVAIAIMHEYTRPMRTN